MMATDTIAELEDTRQLLKTTRRERAEALEALDRARGEVEKLTKFERELVARVAASGERLNWWTAGDDIPFAAH